MVNPFHRAATATTEGADRELISNRWLLGRLPGAITKRLCGVRRATRSPKSYVIEGKDVEAAGVHHTSRGRCSLPDAPEWTA
jgi:hypothetical protein